MAKTNGIEQKWSDLGVSADPVEPVVSKQNWYHNWLYSVVPARLQAFDSKNDWSQITSAIDVYLAGFCINCRKGFTTPIPHSTSYLETQLEVPKDGCVPPPKG